MFSIVVPCFNEKKNLALILERFKQFMDTEEAEVIIVDNGSTDGSDLLLLELLPKYPFAKSVRVRVNQGYGYGILQGLKHATGEFIGWTHADMQTDPKDVFDAFKLIRDHGFDRKLYVKGRRSGRPLFDNFFTVGMSLFESCYLKRRLWDINAQPNIFHKSFFESWGDDKTPHDFSLDLFVFFMARRQNLKILRIPVLFSKRIHGVSSWNSGMKAKIKFIKRTLLFSAKLKKSLKHDLRSP